MAKKPDNTLPILIAVGVAAYLYNAYKIKRPPPFFIVEKLFKGHNGMTVPPFGIWLTRQGATNMALIEHELVHWKQYQQRGLIRFYGDYFRGLRDQGYDAHPMEYEARFREPEHTRANYTEAVRTGKAVTVYNPEFRK